MGTITTELRATIEQGGQEGLARRWRQALLARYPGEHKAKRIARDFHASTKTAESWLATDPAGPSGLALMRGALVHGPAIVLEVLLPGTEAARQAEAEKRIQDLDRRLGELQQLLGSMRTGAP